AEPVRSRPATGGQQERGVPGGSRFAVWSHGIVPDYRIVLTRGSGRPGAAFGAWPPFFGTVNVAATCVGSQEEGVMRLSGDRGAGNAMRMLLLAGTVLFAIPSI